MAEAVVDASAMVDLLLDTKHRRVVVVDTLQHDLSTSVPATPAT